jgi:hypothetical protein
MFVRSVQKFKLPNDEADAGAHASAGIASWARTLR